jgi:Ca2+-binding RTX toxin-like protein
VLPGAVVEAEIAGLAGGLVANVFQSTTSDGSGTSMQSAVHALVRTSTGSGISEIVAGDSLRDIIYGLAGNDTLLGGAGDDALEGGAGNDRLNGGGGLDTVSYLNGTAAVKIDLALTGAQLTGGAGIDTLISIENITGSSFNDALLGSAGANRLNGWTGDDVIEGRDGNDTLNGASGNDTASYASAKSGVTVSLAILSPQNSGGAGTDTLLDIERMTGSAFNDVLTGNAGDNTLKGGAGSDELSGGDGNDVLDGGAGNDMLSGGAGIDWVTYAAAGSVVTVNLATTLPQDTKGGGIDWIGGIENLVGSSFNDRLTGSGVDNVLNGGAGHDTLSGGGGADTLDGGAGNDVLNGGAGIDIASYASAAAAVKVSLAITGAQNTLGAGTDTLSEFENLAGSKFNDTLIGNDAGNLIAGGGGNDTLTGGGGDDTLIGGAGADRLTGSAGADTFRYLSLLDSGEWLSLRDLIKDFGAGDRIDLSAIDADTGTLGDQTFHLDGTTGGAGDIGVAYDAPSNRTIITLYVNNDATVDAAIMLTGNHTGLTAGDFVP